MKPIQTHYDGHFFRSRLEARYAVVFNALKISWRYEPEGFEVPWALEPNTGGTFRYLPDFYLPDLDTWVEVKGHLDLASARKVANAAASFTENLRTKFVLAGDIISQQPRGALPVHLFFLNGLLFRGAWGFGYSYDERGIQPYISIRNEHNQYASVAGLVQGLPGPVTAKVADALQLGRTARFEFGGLA